ncbi:MAG TPA: hypothetical protein PKI05_09190, partial [Thermogutta sp.]|nr:hypothetical protein [Thermogutta sp.]
LRPKIENENLFFCWICHNPSYNACTSPKLGRWTYARSYVWLQVTISGALMCKKQNKAPLAGTPRPILA